MGKDAKKEDETPDAEDAKDVSSSNIISAWLADESRRPTSQTTSGSSRPFGSNRGQPSGSSPWPSGSNRPFEPACSRDRPSGSNRRPSGTERLFGRAPLFGKERPSDRARPSGKEQPSDRARPSGSRRRPSGSSPFGRGRRTQSRQPATSQQQRGSTRNAFLLPPTNGNVKRKNSNVRWRPSRLLPIAHTSCVV